MKRTNEIRVYLSFSTSELCDIEQVTSSLWAFSCEKEGNWSNSLFKGLSALTRIQKINIITTACLSLRSQQAGLLPWVPLFLPEHQICKTSFPKSGQWCNREQSPSDTGQVTQVAPDAPGIIGKDTLCYVIKFCVWMEVGIKRIRAKNDHLMPRFWIQTGYVGLDSAAAWRGVLLGGA